MNDNGYSYQGITAYVYPAAQAGCAGKVPLYKAVQPKDSGSPVFHRQAYFHPYHGRRKRVLLRGNHGVYVRTPVSKVSPDSLTYHIYAKLVVDCARQTCYLTSFRSLRLCCHASVLSLVHWPVVLDTVVLSFPTFTFLCRPAMTQFNGSGPVLGHFGSAWFAGNSEV